MCHHMIVLGGSGRRILRGVAQIHPPSFRVRSDLRCVLLATYLRPNCASVRMFELPQVALREQVFRVEREVDFDRAVQLRTVSQRRQE